MTFRDIDFRDILLDEKLYKTYENILIYGISYTNFISSKSLSVRFDEIDGFIKTYDGIRYLVSFASERYNAIYKRITYLISEKSDIADSINHDFARVTIDSYYSLPIEKTLNFHNFLFTSVLNKNKNNYYFHIFFEKGLYEDKSYTYFFK